MSVILESFSLQTFNNFNNITDITPVLPAGAVDGDLLLFYLRQENNVVVRPDWSVEPFLPLHESQNQFNYMQGALYSVIHDGVSTYTWRSNTTVNADIASVLLRISGHDPAVPIDVSAGPTGCQSCEPASSPAIVVTKENVAVFLFSGGTSQPNIASAVPSGFSSIGAVGGNPIFSAVEAAQRGEVVGPGSIGPFAWGPTGDGRTHDSYTVGVAPLITSGGGAGMAAPSAPSQPTREAIERGVPIKNPFGGRVRRNACMCIGKCVCS